MQIILTKKIPEGWKMVKMSEIANISAGGTPSTKKIEYWGGDIPWMNSGDLNKRIIYKVDGKITKLGMDSSSAKIVPINSVLIGLAGQGKTRGTVAINKIELTTNQSVAFFIPNNINYKFLYFNLYRKYLELRNLSAGDGGRGGLNLQILKNIKLLTPSLPEQNRIVEVLEIWDKFLEKLDQKIKIKKNIKKGLMQNLLTGKIKIKGFDKEWKTVKFGEICKIEKGKALSSKDLEIGNFPVIAGGKTSPYFHNKFTHENVVTVSASGANAGYVSFHLNKIWASDCSVVESIKEKSNIVFLYYFLLNKQKKIYLLQSGGAQPHIYPKDVGVIKFNCPNIEEQNAIANVLMTTDKEIETLEKQREIVKNQKKYLLNNLITGQIRLPEFVNKN